MFDSADLQRERASETESNPVLDTALALSNAGIAVHWLHPRSKKPVLHGWAEAPVETPESLRATYRPGFNVGIRPGEFSRVDGVFLHAIDLDVRDESRAAEAYVWLDERWCDWRRFPVVQSGSGGSSRHIYFFTSEPRRSRSLARSTRKAEYDGRTPWAWQIDLYGTGRQLAAPPSVHPLTGKPYRWLVPLDLEALALGCAPIVSSELLRSWGSAPPERGIESCEGNAAEKLGLTIEEAREILSKLPFEEWGDDRNGWIRTGMALQHEFGDDGFELWNDFSAQSDKFDPEDQERVWKSFRPRPDSIRMATLKQAVRAVEIAESFDDVSDEEAGDEDDLLGPETEQNTQVQKGNAKTVAKRNAAGDIEAGAKFAERYRDEFLHLFRSRVWLHWDGARWAECSRGEEVEAVKSLAAEMLLEAARENARKPNDLNRARCNYAMRLNRDGARVKAALEMARSESDLACAETDFDTDPMLFGVRNGVLDLRSGSFVPPTPSQRIRRQAGASFDPAAQCPRWRKFLCEVLPSPEIQRFVQTCVGYTLTGNVDEEKFFFAYGNGANGKSVFANVCEALLGEYAVTVNSALLTRSRNESEGARLVAKLPGARLVLANETRHSDVWDDQRVKEIVSRERISARRLYAESFSFFPTHKLWVRGNHLPGALDDSEGFWRRLIPVPFEAELPAASRISDLDRQIIAAELSGVLNWALEGCLRWQREGAKLPACISKTAAAYRTDTDLLGAWIGECCSLDANAKTRLGELYQSYRYFCSANGVSAPSKLMFSRQLFRRGGLRKDPSHKHGTRAIGLAMRADGFGLADVISLE